MELDLTILKQYLIERSGTGEINNLPGAGVPYEEPDFPEAAWTQCTAQPRLLLNRCWIDE
ncbi:MAG: hypothetical protein KAI94_04605 [Anaerolineales bacterium]|nr:hypothetical protein [Anaerolineales bacterium]